MIYLVEIDGAAASGAVETLRFGSKAYQTTPTDIPANAVFRSRLKDPGNYERFLFSQGRTFGDSQVATGEVVLVNTDGRLDVMRGLALDGRELRIFALPRVTSPWGDRETVLIATMEQASFNGREVTIRIRDSLERLRDPMQAATYAGTTTQGGSAVAEGNADLKDVKKAQLWGTALCFAPILVDQFENIYHLGTNPVGVVVDVRDSGVKLSPSGNYPTLAELKAASVPASSFATCLAAGYVRTGVRPLGTLTVAASEGVTLADRSAARVARRIIGNTVPVVEADFDALHAAQPAECGLWAPPSDMSRLSAASTILSSIGGYITADRLGRVRVGRLLLPSGDPKATLTRNRIIDRGQGFSLQPTNDPGDGVPAWRVTLRYGRAYTTFDEGELKNVNTDDAFRTFASQEWRSIVREDESVKARHPGASELVFLTSLVRREDAEAECGRLLAIYSRQRNLYEVTQPSSTVALIDLNDCVLLQIPRFGLDAGQLVRVLGVTPTLKSNLTTLEVWG